MPSGSQSMTPFTSRAGLGAFKNTRSEARRSTFMERVRPCFLGAVTEDPMPEFAFPYFPVTSDTFNRRRLTECSTDALCSNASNQITHVFLSSGLDCRYPVRFGIEWRSRTVCPGNVLAERKSRTCPDSTGAPASNSIGDSSLVCLKVSPSASPGRTYLILRLFSLPRVFLSELPQLQPDPLDSSCVSSSSS